MEACTVCGERSLKRTEYKVLAEGGRPQSFPAFECSMCSSVTLDIDAIDLSGDVPDFIRERCAQIAIARRVRGP
jgi:hypothetical protein